MWRQLRVRARSLWRWRRQEAELDEEIRFHLAEETDDRIAEGLPPEAARLAARRDFGNVTLIRELMRETWGWGSAERLWRDIRYGVRALARHWRLSATISLTIAVTIGAGVTLLSVVTPVLLAPLPFSEPERLYRVEARDADGRRVWVSLPTFADWRQRLPDARLAGYSVLDFSVFGDEGPEPILAARVTDDLLDMLGARMALGRAFDGDEYLAGSPRSVILSHAFWQRRYGADSAPTRRSWVGPSSWPVPRLWRAAAASTAWSACWPRSSGCSPTGSRSSCRCGRRSKPQRTDVGAPSKPCWRGSRGALHRRPPASGCRTWRMPSRCGTGLLLGAAGGVIGLCLGTAGASALRTAVPGPLLSRIPGAAEAITVDARVGALAGGAVLVMALLCGLTAFLASGGARLDSILRDASRSTTDAPRYKKVRTAILAPQLALAVALVVTTVVVSVSLVQLRSVGMGLNTERLVSVWLNLDARRYPSAPQRTAFFERVIERVRAIPDVDAVSGIDLPFHQDWPKTPIARAEDRTAGNDYLDDVFARAVTPAYFRMHGIRMLAGRSFAPADAEGARPVAIVSRTLAERLWPDREALGRELRAGRADASDPWLTVVGVAADVRRVPHEPPTATLYRPVRQQTPAWLYLMMRTRTVDPAGLAAGVRKAVWAEDPRQPVEGPWVIARSRVSLQRIPG